jgi:hypothetical protein
MTLKGLTSEFILKSLVSPAFLQTQGIYYPESYLPRGIYNYHHVGQNDGTMVPKHQTSQHSLCTLCLEDTEACARETGFFLEVRIFNQPKQIRLGKSSFYKIKPLR